MSTEDNRTQNPAHNPGHDSGHNPVGWFEIYVADMDRAKAFYGDVVQRDFTPAPMSGGDMEMWFFAAEHGAEAPTWKARLSISAWMTAPPRWPAPPRRGRR